MVFNSLLVVKRNVAKDGSSILVVVDLIDAFSQRRLRYLDPVRRRGGGEYGWFFRLGTYNE